MTNFAKSKLDDKGKKKNNTMLIDEGYNLPSFYDKSYDGERSLNKYEIQMRKMKNKNDGLTFKPKINEGAELLAQGARQRSVDYALAMSFQSESGDEASLQNTWLIQSTI